ncbi:MAG TPA: ATP-binding protein [Bacteriovoracaceae bacterium]|nr:ATP-binding protein [Bacteriovoracaceae bacterium]
MKAERPHYVIHFHNLDQKELNELLKISNRLNLDCCYLGHQKVGEEDFLMIPSSIKISELIKIRQAYSNWIFLILGNSPRAEHINSLNEIGRIYYINEVSEVEIASRLDRMHSSHARVPLVHNDRVPENDALAIISHDLKNPLNAIRLDAQILLRNAKKPGNPTIQEDVKRYASRIIKTTDRLALLVSDLLENDKAENVLVSLTRTPVEAEKLVDEVIEVVSPIAKRNSLKVKKHINGKIPLFLADKNKIFQVLLNLLSNALKFSHQHTSVQITLSSSDNKIFFSIEDSGSGIDPEMEKVIYERYKAGNRRGCGSGLGLYICKTIVEAHQGEIQHRKSAKGGTIFEFFIPLEMQRLETNKNKIYLIDDDEDLRDVLSWALNSEGYHVESFSNPDSALKYLEESSEHPALILSDFSLSNMSAMNFLEKRNLLNLNHVPLLFLTAAPENIQNAIERSSYTDILRKPLDLDDFVLTVSRYMKATSIPQE